MIGTLASSYLDIRRQEEQEKYYSNVLDGLSFNFHILDSLQDLN